MYGNNGNVHQNVQLTNIWSHHYYQNTLNWGPVTNLKLFKVPWQLELSDSLQEVKKFLIIANTMLFLWRYYIYIFFAWRYYAEFPCNFDLRLFPFDEQSCPMEFKMRNAIKAQVIIIIMTKWWWFFLKNLISFCNICNHTGCHRAW